MSKTEIAVKPKKAPKAANARAMIMSIYEKLLVVELQLHEKQVELLNTELGLVVVQLSDQRDALVDQVKSLASQLPAEAIPGVTTVSNIDIGLRVSHTITYHPAAVRELLPLELANTVIVESVDKKALDKLLPTFVGLEKVGADAAAKLKDHVTTETKTTLSWIFKQNKTKA